MADLKPIATLTGRLEEKEINVYHIYIRHVFGGVTS